MNKITASHPFITLLLGLYTLLYRPDMNNEAIIDKSSSNPSAVMSIIRFTIKSSSKIFYLSIFILIYFGWKNREFSNLTPESGAGYWLGIIGGSLMLLLLLYPLRKKIRFFDLFGKIKYWFKLHMLFGVLGPVAILFHANFSLGSTNSNVAFFSMVVVATSGLVGRYLYAKIHHGLYGRKASLKELRESLKESRGKLGTHHSLTKNVVEKIKTAERLLLRNRNIFVSVLLWPFIFIKTELLKRSVGKAIYKTYQQLATERGWDKGMVRSLSKDANKEVQPYINGLYEMYGFRIFEGLFSFWHFLHLPLFIMLVFSGILHVIVVHSY